MTGHPNVFRNELFRQGSIVARADIARQTSARTTRGQLHKLPQRLFEFHKLGDPVRAAYGREQVLQTGDLTLRRSTSTYARHADVPL